MPGFTRKSLENLASFLALPGDGGMSAGKQPRIRDLGTLQASHRATQRKEQNAVLSSMGSLYEETGGPDFELRVEAVSFSFFPSFFKVCWVEGSGIGRA